MCRGKKKKKKTDINIKFFYPKINRGEVDKKNKKFCGKVNKNN